MVLELGCGVSEPSVQRVLAERDADSGQVTVQQNPPTGRQNRRPPDRRRAERGGGGRGARRQRHTASGCSGGGGARGGEESVPEPHTCPTYHHRSYPLKVPGSQHILKDMVIITALLPGVCFRVLVDKLQ